MKKVLSLLLIAILSLSVLLTSCGGGKTEDEQKALDLAAKVAEAQGLTTEELVAKAKEETGKFVAYGNTSRITTAMANFVEKYGAQIGLTADNAVASKQSDSDIYTLLTNESIQKNNSEAASMVLIQDSATLATYRENTTILTNYVPKGMSDVMGESEMVPLAHQYINKLFIYNNQGDNVPTFNNVWDLTKSEFANKIYFKSPTSEQVNMNFLIMLTSKEWSDKLEKAYKDCFGSAATDVGAGKKYESYGYKWIAEFLANADTASYTSDTKMAAGVSKAEGKLGLFVLSKLRDSSVTTDNLQVAAWAKDSGNNFVEIEPFAGFMYSIYAQLATNGPRPYTAMLFINFLMTQEGFAPWGESVGGYSANSSVPVLEGDQPLSFWKDKLVYEDGAYISSVKATVIDYINGLLAK